MRLLRSESPRIVGLLLFAAVCCGVIGGAEGRRIEPSISGAKVDSHWVAVTSSSSSSSSMAKSIDDATILGPVHLYRDLDNVTVAASAASAACPHDHTTLDARAKCKRDALGFTAADVAALSEWLAPVGDTTLTHEAFLQKKSVKGCHVAWNAVHCRGVSVAAAKQMFGNHIHFRAMRKKTTAAANKKPAVHVLTTDSLEIPDALQSRLTAVISHVGGLHPYDTVEMSARHMGRAGNPQGEPIKKTSAPSPDQATPYTLSPDPYTQYDWRTETFDSANAWATQNYGNAMPYVYHMSSLFVYVVPVCGDGYLAQSSNWPATTWADYCGVHQPAPAKVTVNVTRFADGRVGASVFVADVNPNHCMSANDYTSTSNGIICRVYIAAAMINASSWEQFTATVSESFADGAAAPMSGGYRNFMNGVTYAVGSADIYGEYITNPVATPSITRPAEGGVTPAVILNQYDVPSSARADSVIQGVVEFSDTENPGDGFDETDLQTYLTQIARLPSESSSSSNYQIIGDSTIVSAGETTLDIELIMGVARGARSYLYCISYGPSGDYASYADALAGFASTGMNELGTFSVSGVWSISYGGPEWTSSPSLMKHVNTLLGELTDAGVTVTASSGDTGCYFITSDQVYHSANWPATSPYVVGVGATAFAMPASGSSAQPLEETCNVRNGNVITSGGGYSSMFSRPEYQNTAVASTQLGLPDVATVGAWIATILDGEEQPLFGTSASSPIFAAMVSLINQQRFNNYALNSSKPSGPLRQAPKFLYDASFNNPASFRDIFVGDNCNSEQVGSLGGNFPTFGRPNCYDAQTGWDAVTGLGTPSYRELLPRSAVWNPAALPKAKSPDTTLDSTVGAIVIGVAILGSVLVFGVCRMRRSRGTPLQQQQHLQQPPPPEAPVIGTPYQAFPVAGEPVAAQHAGAIYTDDAV